MPAVRSSKSSLRPGNPTPGAPQRGLCVALLRSAGHAGSLSCMGSTDALDMPGRRALGHIGRGNWRLFVGRATTRQMARGRGATRPISGQERSPIPERLAAARFDLRFADHIEAKFRDAIAPHILRPWDELPDGHRDQMRWAFRRSRLDRDVPEALAAKLATIMRDLTQRPAYDRALLEHASGRDGHEIVVERRTLGTSKGRSLATERSGAFWPRRPHRRPRSGPCEVPQSIAPALVPLVLRGWCGLGRSLPRKLPPGSHRRRQPNGTRWRSGFSSNTASCSPASNEITGIAASTVRPRW